MAVRLTVVGSSPAWPNPGGAQSGYLVEDGGGRLLLDCGPGVARPAARAGRRLAARRRDRDHALAPRPLGRSRALGLGQPGRAGHGKAAAPSSGCRPRAASGSGTSASRLGWDDMFDQTFDVARLPGGRAVRGRRLHARSPGGCPTTRCSPSASASRTAARLARLLGRLRARRRARRAGARRRPLRLRGDARARRARRHAARAPVRRRGGRRVPRPRARGGSCSRTGRASCRSRTASSSPTTGWSSRSTERPACRYCVERDRRLPVRLEVAHEPAAGHSCSCSRRSAM